MGRVVPKAEEPATFFFIAQAAFFHFLCLAVSWSKPHVRPRKPVCPGKAVCSERGQTGLLFAPYLNEDKQLRRAHPSVVGLIECRRWHWNGRKAPWAVGICESKPGGKYAGWMHAMESQQCPLLRLSPAQGIWTDWSWVPPGIPWVLRFVTNYCSSEADSPACHICLEIGGEDPPLKWSTTIRPWSAQKLLRLCLNITWRVWVCDWE